MYNFSPKFLLHAIFTYMYNSLEYNFTKDNIYSNKVTRSHFVFVEVHPADFGIM